MSYTSKSQIARVFTEAWVAKQGYCLACESDRLIPTAINTQARDFECALCGHPYELKSSLRPFGAKLVDGAFASMMGRIEANTTSSFLLMRYSDQFAVTSLTALHSSLITPEIIQRRPPLSESARRAGWVGCNLLLNGIPPEGRISLVRDGVALPKHESRAQFSATAKLAAANAVDRGWARTLLSMLHRLGGQEFNLEQTYAFEGELSLLYSNNKHIKAKIRQQLQVLRDAGLLVFKGQGRYRLVYGTKP